MSELYKKHRPTKLGQMVGNRAALKTLSGMLKGKSVPQVILFHGPSGCGKTTLARIVQSHMGCSDLDRAELNSASFRGIDSIRSLIRDSRLSPMGDARVWILDEVHKWTGDAQEAALKLMEDTPPNVYFFLCTTEPQKLKKALRNRCTEIAVSALTSREIHQVLSLIPDVPTTKEQRDLIADHAEGSARRALVLLDQLRHLPADDWATAIAQDSEEAVPGVRELCKLLLHGRTKWSAVAKILKEMTAEPESVRWGVLGYCTAVLLQGGGPQAYNIISCFSTPFYDTKKAGLVASCFECLMEGE